MQVLSLCTLAEVARRKKKVLLILLLLKLKWKLLLIQLLLLLILPLLLLPLIQLLLLLPVINLIRLQMKRPSEKMVFFIFGGSDRSGQHQPEILRLCSRPRSLS